MSSLLNSLTSVPWRIAFALKETGQALERVGCRLQGIYSYEEPCDHQPVVIGANSNIQDGAYIGTANEYSPPAVLGTNVSVGHGAVIKGATVGDNALIGINAVVSEGAKVGNLSIVAAGSYVEEDTEIPAGEVWAGNPAKKLRDVKPEEKEYLKTLPGKYVDQASKHATVMTLLRKKQEEFAA